MTSERKVIGPDGRELIFDTDDPLAHHRDRIINRSFEDMYEAARRATFSPVDAANACADLIREQARRKGDQLAAIMWMGDYGNQLRQYNEHCTRSLLEILTSLSKVMSGQLDPAEGYAAVVKLIADQTEGFSDEMLDAIIDGTIVSPE